MATIRYDSHPYDRERHEGFVKTSWCHGARQGWEALSYWLRRPETAALVASRPGNPDDLLGWAVVNRGRVVWAYTRKLFGRLRKKGLMTALLLELGIDPSQPTPCLFWSPDAAAIAARGYHFVYAPRGRKEAA